LVFVPIVAIVILTSYLAIGQEGIAQEDTADPFQVPAGLKELPIPDDNPLTEAKIALGRQLFFDERLSHDNSVSCATCHDPAKGWSNAEAFATGIRAQVGGRNTPTIINAAYQHFQFWDGRAQHLEGQAMGPVANPIEMGMELEEMEQRLNKIEGYRKQFEAVFGEPANADNTAKAIAAFERTVLSGNAPYDQFKAGDESALSAAAQRGMKLFMGKANCSACHSGSNFSDGAFHNLGVGMDQPEPDLGRFVVTNVEGDKGSFRTPTLREISQTGPYMHNGSLKSLEEVVDFYDKGGIANPQLDEELFPLKLTDQQKSDLVTFLKEGLSSEHYPLITAPALPK
jgi:cytochrome c peroxidase